MSFGSSAEPIGGGSTYFSVVKSAKIKCQEIVLIAPGVFKVIRALFRIDLLLKEEVDCGDDQVGNDVKGSNTHENVGVVKWHLFRHLHHAENNHQIGAVKIWY